MKKLTKYILSEFGGRAVIKDDLKEVCRRFGENAERVVNFMISYGYLIRILRELYYVKTLEEFKMRIRINGEDVKFIKLKKELFGFGVVEKNELLYSDLEKTLLDMVYLARYRSVAEERTVSILREYGGKARKERMKEYLKFYPKSVERVVRNAGLV